MAATQGDFPDGRMQKMMGKPWSSWNLPEQPTDLDLRKLRDAFQPPEQFKTTNESTPLATNYVSLFGTHPDSDFLSINKCAACGWLLKIQHANKHYLRDSRGAIVCRESDLAIFENRVIGKACHPVGELSETYSRKILMKLLQPPPHTLSKSSHSLRGAPSITELVSKSRSGSHSSKTDYLSHSYRSRSHSSQVHTPSSSYNMPKSRSSTSSGSHGSLSVNSSSSLSKSKSVKSSHSSSTSTWSSLRSSNSSKSTHKSTSGSYTLSIPSEDMGQNESVEDLLMSNMTHSYSSSKHTVHIIATSNASKSKPTDSQDYDHIKFYSDVPEKRLKLDSHSHHKSSLSHTSSSDGHDSYSRSKSKHSSSSIMNGTSSHGLHSDSKKSKSSSSSHSKNDSGSGSSSSNKHHLRSTSSTLVTVSKPYSSTAPSLSSSSGSSSSRSHHFSSSMSSIGDKEKDKDRSSSSSSKKKKRKRDKDEPRKIIPLKDRDFNPDKHCGVCTPGSNLPCKRSLTCKTHSVASRRAVSGRSQSFDALLAAHKLAKTEEKKLSVKEEEPLPPKAKKKKPSGGSSSLGLSPNDQPTALAHEHTSYVRTRSPDIEVISVKTATASKPKPAPQPKPEKPPEKQFLMPALARYPPKKFKTCPLVYPYTPDLQAKFEGVWNNPSTLQRHQQMTYEEKNKFLFLLKHYKNPFFLNVDTVAKPVPKNTREKRNVFSNWNPAQTPVSGSQRPLNSWSTSGDSKRQMNDSDDPIVLAHITRK